MIYKFSSHAIWLTAATCLLALLSCKHNAKEQTVKRPNILFVIADDQSFPYSSVYGATGVHTPAFDKVAENGVLFYNAFAAAPQCSPSRAAILTGKNIWQLEEAGTHSSYFPKKFPVFTDLLENAGYKTGYTGKAWGPGNWKDAGWTRNPVGPEYNKKKLVPPTKGISPIDYFSNFVDFYEEKNPDEPFFFWYGANEPHRPYTEGSGQQIGKKLADADMPRFLPDDSTVRSDIEDYAAEIEWFDQQLAKMIDFLREKGQLENTLIVVTSDNGMPFPAAKANLMEYGSHVPLAISWPAKIKGGRIARDLVSLIDLAPTFLQVAGIKETPVMTGKSMGNILFPDNTSGEQVHRDYVLTGRERHSDARPDNLGYPSRAIRTEHYLFVLNCKPDRWPAGNPPPPKEEIAKLDREDPSGNFKSIGTGYNDIDDPSPTKSFMMKHRAEWPELFAQGFERRPAEQLFDIEKDPDCITNLANVPAFDSVRTVLNNKLADLLTKQGDPRMLGYGDIFESYPRFGLMRNWPGFKERGAYNPAYQNNQPQLKKQ
ncbi:sulfatase [Chitinophaga sp. MM2321]|uniref:sulfatase family protein n=1 Tax=Chitinophaga sp. MM2321 TaxID=3137178 RepID=UPI0032D57DF4